MRSYRCMGARIGSSVRGSPRQSLPSAPRRILRPRSWLTTVRSPIAIPPSCARRSTSRAIGAPVCSCACSVPVALYDARSGRPPTSAERVHHQASRRYALQVQYHNALRRRRRADAARPGADRIDRGRCEVGAERPCCLSRAAQFGDLCAGRLATLTVGRGPYRRPARGCGGSGRAEEEDRLAVSGGHLARTASRFYNSVVTIL